LYAENIPSMEDYYLKGINLWGSITSIFASFQKGKLFGNHMLTPNIILI
jgi:hypothetical protein